MSLPTFEARIDDYDLENYIEINAEEIKEFLGVSSKYNEIDALFREFESDNYNIVRIVDGLSNKCLNREDFKKLAESYNRLKDKILSQIL